MRIPLEMRIPLPDGEGALWAFQREAEGALINRLAISKPTTLPNVMGEAP